MVSSEQRAIVVEFRDDGQDFLRWTIENGKVVDCQPFQGWVWEGTEVLNAETVKPGEFLQIRSKHTGEITAVIHAVESVHPLTEEAPHGR